MANKLTKKHLLWVKNTMKVKLVAQTLSASVATAIDFLREEAKIPEFQGSAPTTKFIKVVDCAFDMLNSQSPFAKGFKAPVKLSNLQNWLEKCHKTVDVDYFLSLKDSSGNFIRNNKRKTAIWGFVYSIHSLMSLSQELLTRDNNPLKYILTYKFSQDHLELVFSKIGLRGGHNNNPRVVQLKAALRSILLRNSIEPARTGNCTKFDDALRQLNGFLNFSLKSEGEQQNDEVLSEDDISCEQMLIELDQESSNELQDSILYYIGGNIARSLLKSLQCSTCKSTVLLDPENPHGEDMSSYPPEAKFTSFKQKGGLLFPSLAVFKIIKTAEVIFKRRVLWEGKGMSFKKNLKKRIESAVLEQLGLDIFATSQDHFFEHALATESDHLSALLRLITLKYVSLRLKTYGKRFTEMVAHKNVPSLRHTLTKAILFKNQ